MKMGEFADRAMALYQLREEQRDFQRNLINQHGGAIDLDQPARFVFDLRQLSQNRNDRYQLQQRRYEAQLRQEGNVIDNLMPALRDGLQNAIQRLIDEREVPNNHRVYFDIFSDRLRNQAYRANGLVAADWRNSSHMVDQIFQNLQNTLNSQEAFGMDDTFRIEVTTVAPRNQDRGTGRARRKKLGYLGAEDFLLKNKSVIRINNNDELCGARATIASQAAVDYPDKHGTRRLLTKKEKGISDRPQKQAAYRLCQQAGVPEGPVGPEELKKFQAVLPNHRLLCVYLNRNNEVVSFCPYSPDKKDIVILYYDGHYHGCNSLNSFLQTSYYCPFCFKGYNNQGQHRCESLENTLCKCCRRKDCPDFQQAYPQHLKPTLRCEPCGRYFYGPTCLAHHHQYTVAGAFNLHKSICKTVRHCKSCGKLNNGMTEQKRHKCGYSDCPTCKAYADLKTHKCFIESANQVRKRKEELKEKAAKRRRMAEEDPEDPEDPEDQTNRQEKKPPLHVYVDFEARQDTGQHVANLCVYQTDEGVERVIEGEDCVKIFINELKEMSEEDTREVIVIAHNLQAYDGYFVIEELYRDGKTVKQIRAGAKIIELRHYGIKFIDSLNFFSMPLSDFPKTFGLKLYARDAAGRLITDEDGNYREHPLAKGFFPHLFNRLENQQYVGPLPPVEDYMPLAMSKDKKKEFDKWYKEQIRKNVIFDFRRELVEYCKLDVTILRLGCQTFQELFIRESHFNPFEHPTIASACNRDLIENRLDPKKIASEPTYGWNGEQGNQSKEALEWLQWMDYQNRKNVSLEEREFHDQMKTPKHRHPAHRKYVEHAGNGGERYIADIQTTVDGFDPEKNTIYQFQGCYWHGCTTCFPNQSEVHYCHAGRRMYEVREKTRRTTNQLRRAGYNVVEMWGCEWIRKKREDDEISEFVKTLDFVERLNPRHAFFGGRTNAAKMYHKCQPHEKILYMDFTSLYPTVNKYGLYPTGHPEIILNSEDQDITHYFGIAQCTVRAPRKLYHPVLPVRLNNKLLFPLCCRCAEEQLQAPMLERSCRCPHDDVDREFIGTWCTPELVEAQEQGYTISKAGEQVLYYDTDSIVLLVDEENPSHYVPQTGNYLGEFTDELVDKKTGISYPITEFVSAGPKNYGYEQTNGKRECKVKGFSLNTEGSRYLNYDVMKQNVLAELTDPLLDRRTGRIIPRKHQVKRTHRIVRDPKDLSIQTVAEVKNYSMVYEKRVIDLNTFLTYPYGYGDIDITDMEEDIHALLDL